MSPSLSHTIITFLRYDSYRRGFMRLKQHYQGSSRTGNEALILNELVFSGYTHTPAQPVFHFFKSVHNLGTYRL